MKHAKPRFPLHRRRTRRSILAMVMLGLAIVGTGSLTSTTATAAVVRVAGIAHASTYMGVEDFHGGVGVCTGNGRATPTVLTTPTRVYAPTAAWALNAKIPGDPAALSDDEGAAIATVVKTDPAVPSNHQNSTPDVGVNGRADQIRAEAAAYGGARSIPLSVTDTSAGAGLTWDLGGIGIQAPGGLMAGYPLTLSISGPVVFAANGTNTLSLTTSGGFQNAALTSTGTGAFTVSASTSVPSNFINSHPAENGGYQIVATRTGFEPLGAATDPALAAFDFGVEISTSVPTVRVTSTDTEIVDTISYDAAPGDDWMIIPINGTPSYVPVLMEADVYGPYDEESAPAVDTPVDDTPAFTMTHLAEDGPESGIDVTADEEWADLEPGIYTINWKVIKANQGAYQQYIRGDFTDGWFTLGETFVRTAPLTHVSHLRQEKVAEQVVTIDTYTISGYPDNHPTYGGGAAVGADNPNATVRVYGPFDEGQITGSAVPADAKVHWEQTVEASNGTFDVGNDPANPISNLEAGKCYVGVYSFEGDDRVEAYTSPFDDAEQRLCIAVPPADLPSTGASAGWGMPLYGLLMILTGGGLLTVRRKETPIGAHRA